MNKWNLQQSMNWLREMRRAVESIDTPEGETATTSGTGFGKVASKASWESKNSREPK